MALGGGDGPAGKLFSGSFDHTVRRWDTRMWQCDLVLRGHKGYVHAMTLGDGCLVTGCADKTIKASRTSISLLFLLMINTIRCGGK
jgi:WD40 repeat protein